MFDLSYIALNAGGTIQANNNSIVTEQVTVGAGGVITVSETPVVFGDNIYGWVSEAGKNEYQTVIFSGNTATTSLPEGTIACVKYNKNNTAMKYFTVSSSVIPSIVHMIMTYPLFAGGTTDDISSKTQVGELIVDIPRFQFSGGFDLSLTSSGAATSNLSGQALATQAGTSCEDMSQYGTIKLNLFDSVWYDGLEAMFIEDAESELGIGDSKTLAVYGVYKGGVVGFIPNSLLTFSSSATAKVTVGANTGVVNGVAAGESTIEAKPTAISGSPVPAGVAAYADITVE